MNELYCKRCSEYIGKSGDPSKLPKECPKCGMKFYTKRINKMMLYGLIAGGGQLANKQYGKYIIFGWCAGMALFCGSIFLTPIVGIILSGLVVFAGMGEAISTAEEMAGFSHSQVAKVEYNDS